MIVLVFWARRCTRRLHAACNWCRGKFHTMREISHWMLTAYCCAVMLCERCKQWVFIWNFHYSLSLYRTGYTQTVDSRVHRLAFLPRFLVSMHNAIKIFGLIWPFSLISTNERTGYTKATPQGIEFFFFLICCYTHLMHFFFQSISLITCSCTSGEWTNSSRNSHQ